MEFGWDEGQRQLAEDMRTFARTQWSSPHPPDGFDRAAWRALAATGLPRWPLPADWGGRDLCLLDLLRALEALGQGGAERGFLFALGAHLLGAAIPLSRHLNHVQRQQWAEPLASGQLLAALAVTEKSGGSDPVAMATRAESDGDRGYRISGQKIFVTNAPDADLFLVLASEKPDRGAFGLTAFLIPRETPGLSVNRHSGTLGLQGAPMGAVAFADCQVPAQAVVGGSGAGLRVFSTCMQWERTGILAGLLGAAERDIGRAAARMQEKRDRRGALFEHEAVALRLARMQVRLEGARLLLYRAAWEIDQGRRDLAGAATAKFAASEALVEITLDLVRVTAGEGWIDPHGLGGGLADVVGTLSASGTSDVQLAIIARTLGRGDPA